MKRHGILNPQLSRLIAELGHTDLLVIADAGLPIPEGVERIDLSLVEGVPSLEQVLAALLDEVVVEASMMASETDAVSPESANMIRGMLPTIDEVSHEELKQRSTRARAIVRTGECTPYNNVLLYCGVRDAFSQGSD